MLTLNSFVTRVSNCTTLLVPLVGYTRLIFLLRISKGAVCITCSRSLTSCGAGVSSSCPGTLLSLLTLLSISASLLLAGELGVAVLGIAILRIAGLLTSLLSVAVLSLLLAGELGVTVLSLLSVAILSSLLSLLALLSLLTLLGVSSLLLACKLSIASLLLTSQLSVSSLLLLARLLALLCLLTLLSISGLLLTSQLSISSSSLTTGYFSGVICVSSCCALGRYVSNAVLGETGGNLLHWRFQH